MSFTGMLNRTSEKLKSKKAMTLSEVLITVLLLTLATGIIAACISLGVRLFIKEKRVSQAQMLLDALTVSVQDELRYATGIQSVSGGTWFTYSSRNRAGSKDCSFLNQRADDKEEQHVVIMDGTNQFELVSGELYRGLDATIRKDEDASKAWDGELFYLQIDIKVKGSEELVTQKKFTIEPLNKEYVQNNGIPGLSGSESGDVP